MIRLARELRLIPVVLIATMCLFALKTLGLVLDGGYVLGQGNDRPLHAAMPPTPVATLDSPSQPLVTPATGGRQSWAQEMFNFPDVTGSVTPPKPPEGGAKPDTKAEGKPDAKGDAKPDAKADAKPDPKAAPAQPAPVPEPTIAVDAKPTSAAERAILERLQQRRQELDARARELDIRESLLKGTEKRVEAKLAEIKEVESRITTANQQKDEAEAARFKGLVSMYENMKAKDAAKIFDRLDMRILIDVSTQMNPRRMSDILAQMSTDAAERLTVELANRASMTKAEPSMDLPKIEGRRNGT